MKKLLQGLILSLLSFAGQAHAASTGTIDLLTHPVGIICLVIFIFAYVLVILEEKIHILTEDLNMAKLDHRQDQVPCPHEHKHKPKTGGDDLLGGANAKKKKMTRAFTSEVDY